MNPFIISLSERGKLLPALVLFQLAAFCLFANTFGNAWTYDDFPVIVENADIRSIHGFLQNTYPGRPLREITYLLDYSVFGLLPAGYHLQNIFWHALNAFFIWLLASDLGASKWVARISGVVFLAHPLNVEVVANISHRKDSLALAFCLISLLCFIRIHREGTTCWKWLAGTVLFWGIALSAKQNAAILPVMYFAYEFLYCPQEKQYLFNKKSKVLLLVSFFGLLCWYIHAKYLSGVDLESSMRMILATKANFTGSFSFSIYYATILKAWFLSWSKLILPFKLAPEYSFGASLSWFEIHTILAIVAICCIAVTILKTHKTNPIVSFGLLWFLVFWLPTANLLPQVYLAADRYLYSPTVGVILVVCSLVSHAFRNKANYGAMFAGGVILILSVLTWTQNAVWRSPENLWSQAVRVSPDSSFALNNLGNVYLLKGEHLQAKSLYERSTRVNPMNPTAWYNLGIIYENAGLTQQALENYRKFLKINAHDFEMQAAELKKRFPGNL